MSNRSISLSKENLDIELRNLAKKMSHHTPADFVVMIRQRCNAAITLEYATELLGAARIMKGN